jgi:hypothetical protein
MATEKTMHDAPPEYDHREANAWANGYNSAIEYRDNVMVGACSLGSNPEELLRRAEVYISRTAADGRRTGLLVMELADVVRAALQG